MSSGCGDVLSLEDLKTAKKHQTFEAEVITGHAGGVSSGVMIDYATNTATGQIQKTMPAILRDVGFEPAGFDFASGGTLSADDRDKVVFNAADGNWYSWSGSLPHVVAAGTDPTIDTAWVPRIDPSLRGDFEDFKTDISSHALPGALLVALKHGFVSDALNFITPEMFGAVGDGVTDDYAAIQAMFDTAPEGANLVFDSSKTYYNAFNSGSWVISKRFTVNFNGALLTRKTPVAVTDNQSSVIKVSGVSGINLLNCNINGNNPIGYPYNLSGVQATSGNQTSLCQAIDYGIYLLNSNNVVITGVIEQCAFNIWAKSSYEFRVNGTLNYGGQVVPNITSSDLAYGAGIKLSDCYSFDIDVFGKGNANATVEVEPNANHGRVVQRSINNLSSGLTITNSYGIIFDSYTDHASIGTQITQNGNNTAHRIMGRSVANSCGWGFLLNLQASATNDMKNISVDIICTNCRSYGLYIFNQNATKSIDYDLRYTGDGNYTNGAGTSGNDIVVTGNCQGRVSGSSKGCYNAFLVSGTQLQGYPPKFDMDVKGAISVDYFISPGSYADISGTRTKTTHIVSAGSNFTKLHMYRMSPGGAQGNLTDWLVKSEHAYFIPMPTTYTFNNSVYAVLESGNTYALKVRL